LVILILDNDSSSRPSRLLEPSQNTLHKYIKREHIDKVHKFSRSIKNSLPDFSEPEDLLLSSSGSGSVNLWTGAVPVLDQGPFGSCVAFSARYAHMIRLSNQNMPLVEPSCAYWYSIARQRIGISSSNDSGTTLAAMAWTLTNKPVVSETSWKYTAYNILRQAPNLSGSAPYDNSAVTVFSRPNRNTTTFLAWVKAQLLNTKSVVIGIPVYSNFEWYSTIASGVIPMPRGSYLGGHAITLVGYSDAAQRFNFVNSWGTYVGLSGLFTIPYNYVKNYTFEAYSL
jgi:C1A family cysteine protease